MITKRPTGGVAASLALLGGATAAGALVLAVRGRQEPAAPSRGALVPSPMRFPLSPAIDRKVSVRAAQRLNRAAGTIAASVLFDSAMEHYRGSFANKAMFTPLLTSALSLAASLHGSRDRSPAAHAARDTAYSAAGLTGIVGTGFHVYNIGKRPGGFCWQNFFYSAPIGAPAALVLSGLLGFLAERVRNNKPGTLPTILGLPAGRALAATTGAGLLGTVGEVGLLHFRGACHNPFMFLPVTVPPRRGRPARRERAGPGPQAAPVHPGVAAPHRAAGRGGRRLPRHRRFPQHGRLAELEPEPAERPPIPAPPSFTGLALAGLAALSLLEDHPDD